MSVEEGGVNPCDTCKREMDCFDCAFGGYTDKHECCNHDCFLNYEGSCMVGVYDRCGAWQEHT